MVSFGRRAVQGSPRPWARAVQASAIGAKPSAVPQVAPALERLGQRRPAHPAASAAGARMCSANAVAGRSATSGGVRQVDADADRQPEAAAGLRTGLDQDAGGLAPAIIRSLGHFRRDQRRPAHRRSARSATARAATKETCAASAGGLSVIDQQGGGEIAVAGLPGPAAPARGRRSGARR